MAFLHILSFAGGAALFLYGMRLMGDAVRRQAGTRFRDVLRMLTSNKWRAALVGTGVTAVIQSSSAVSIMVLGFVNSGIMDLESAVSLVIGANMGTCATSWLTSLNGLRGGQLLRLLSPEAFVPVLALTGVLLQMFSRHERRRNAGLIALGFSLLMYGMEHMSGALAPLTESQNFRRLLVLFSHPALGVALGFFLAAATQSSSAAIGILQAVAAAADIRFATAFPVVLGINAGAAVIVMLAAAGGNRNARRVGLAAFLLNTVGAAVFLVLWLLTERLFPVSLGELPMDYLSLAATHTVYKFLLAALALPLLDRICGLTRRILPPDGSEDRFQLLDDRFLETPAVAVAWCRELADDMVLMAQDAVSQALEQVEHFEESRERSIGESEEKCDMYEDKLGSYMVKLSQKRMADGDSREAFKILHCLGDVERISDHAVSIARAGREICKKGLDFPAATMDDLRHVTAPVQEIVKITAESFLRNDCAMARRVEPLEQVVDMIIEQVKARHIARLQSGECTILRGFVFSDLLTDLSRISDHCSNIAACVIGMSSDSLDTHRYLNALKAGDRNFETMLEGYAREYGFGEQ